MNDLSRKEQARLEKVRSRGLEPPCLSTLVPETSASAISPRARDSLFGKGILRPTPGQRQGKVDYRMALRSRRLLAMTETLLSAMAALASIGLSRSPKNG